MPAPARPAGPISPSDLLWKHELREQNASLLHRMNTLEAKMKDQERKILKTEEATTACTGLAEDFDIVKDGIDQLETKQREFICAVHKRLVDMDKEMEEFRKTQDRVQKLMVSYRDLDDSVTNLSSLKSRVTEMTKEVQGLKNSVDRKYVHEMKDLGARLEALELQRSQEDTRIRDVQEDFTKRWSLELHTLHSDIMALKESRSGVLVSHSYLQVPRSPETGSRAPSQQAKRTKAQRKTPMCPRKDDQTTFPDHETPRTAQTGNRVERVDEVSLDTNIAHNTLPRGRDTLGINHRKRPKLSHPVPLPLEPELKDPPGPTKEPQQRHQTGKASVASHKTARPSPSKAARLAIDPNSKKRPASPTVTPRLKNIAPVAMKSPKQSNPRQKILPVPRTRQLQPSQPTRRSRRRSVQATFYELGWDCTQQPQKIAGPVYDGTQKPLKTKPRRLPPVPDE